MTTDTRPTFQPVHIVLLIIAAAGLLFIWLWPSINAPEPQVIQLPQPVEASPSSIQTVEATPKLEAINHPAKPQIKPETVKPTPVAPKLPSLNDSDSAVLSELKQPQFQLATHLLTNEYVIRKVVRAVAAASNGEWVNQHHPLLPPKTVFTATQQGSTLHISAANFNRYTPYIDALDKIGSKNIATLYTKYLPLLQQAYEELGLKDKDFLSVTLKAITQINAAPEYTNEELVHPSVMYKFKNKQIEALPEVQKVLIRMGAENQSRLKALLTEVKLALE